MTRKQQIRLGVITGIIFILIYLILSLFYFSCPTENQYLALRFIISLGAAGFSITIPGFIEVKYKNIITASGAISVFVIVLIVNPAPINSLTHCNDDITIKGNIYLDNKPFEMAEISFIEFDSRRIYTNDNGNFRYVHKGRIEYSELTIRIKCDAMNIDTSIITKNFLKPLRFKLFHNKNLASNRLLDKDNSNVYCIECVIRNSKNKEVHRKNKCREDSLYLINYIQGLSVSSKEQGETVKCEWSIHN